MLAERRAAWLCCGLVGLRDGSWHRRALGRHFFVPLSLGSMAAPHGWAHWLRRGEEPAHSAKLRKSWPQCPQPGLQSLLITAVQTTDGAHSLSVWPIHSNLNFLCSIYFFKAVIRQAG